MSKDAEQIFNSLEIRDTSSHTSSQTYNGDFIVKTLIIENGLNQTVTLQCQASANDDFSNSFNVGSTFDVSASTNTYQTCESYFPYWRITAVCSSSPSSGDLTVHIFKVEA